MLLNADSAVVVDIVEDIAFGQCLFSFGGRTELRENECIFYERTKQHQNSAGPWDIRNSRAPTALAPSL